MNLDDAPKVERVERLKKEESGAEVLVAGVMQTSDPRRPALKALPNLSLNVSDTLRATRAK